MANTKNHALLSDQKILTLTIGLCDEFSRNSTAREVAELLAVLMTPQEVRMFSIRLRICDMLLNNACYEEIKAELGTSSGTISRVRLALENLDQRPRSDHPLAPSTRPLTRAKKFKSAKYPHGPMAKYAANGWPIHLVASIFREIAEKRPPPRA